MPGTKAGGLKAAKTNKEKHGKDFYKNIGRKGGKQIPKRPRGFASDVVGKDGLTGAERSRIAGAKGGKISRRGPSKYPHVPKTPMHKTAPKAEEEIEEPKRGGWKWLFFKKEK